jgi:hypothetical protein
MLSWLDIIEHLRSAVCLPPCIRSTEEAPAPFAYRSNASSIQFSVTVYVLSNPHSWHSNVRRSFSDTGCGSINLMRGGSPHCGQANELAISGGNDCI